MENLPEDEAHTGGGGVVEVNWRRNWSTGCCLVRRQRGWERVRDREKQKQKQKQQQQ